MLNEAEFTTIFRVFSDLRILYFVFRFSFVLCWGGDFATIFTARSKRCHASGSNSISFGTEDFAMFTPWQIGRRCQLMATRTRIPHTPLSVASYPNGRTSRANLATCLRCSSARCGRLRPTTDTTRPEKPPPPRRLETLQRGGQRFLCQFQAVEGLFCALQKKLRASLIAATRLRTASCGRLIGIGLSSATPCDQPKADLDFVWTAPLPAYLDLGTAPRNTSTRH